MRKIIEAFEVNEAKKIQGFKMYTNFDDSALEEFSGFIKDVETFAKKLLPKMSDPNNEGLGSLEMVLDLGQVVGSPYGTIITFYGWNKFNTEDEFERVWNKNSMDKYIKRFLYGKMKKYNSVDVSTYWTAKRSFGYSKRRTIETGPYVEVTYSNDDIRD